MRAPTAVLWWVCVVSSFVHATDHGGRTAEISRSVVEVTAICQAPDCFQPWQRKSQDTGSGSGCVIDGRWILTNAHVVADSIYVTVSRSDEGVGYPATVVHIAHDCDLALLYVADEDFWKGLKPLDLDDLPELGDQVAVFGFPIGGSKLSVTNGIVSRIEPVEYSHSNMELLAIQVDAAINPGNSGGPVIKDGKIVGIAFQGIDASEADNIGRAVPTPIIKRFLTDVKDGVYNGIPSLSIRWQSMLSHNMRAFYKMAHLKGVLVTAVSFDGPLHGHVHPGDILLSVDGRSIDSGGMTAFGTSDRICFEHVIAQKQVEETVDLAVLRGGAVVSMKCFLRPPAPLVPYWAGDERSRYYIFGGLIFVSLTRDYVDGLFDRKSYDSPVFEEILQYIDNGMPTQERRRVVLLSSVLPDDTNFGYHSLHDHVVVRVNGKSVCDLKDLAKVLDEIMPTYHAIDLSDGTQVVLNVWQSRRATARIVQQFGIPQDRSSDLAPKLAGKTP